MKKLILGCAVAAISLTSCDSNKKNNTEGEQMDSMESTTAGSENNMADTEAMQTENNVADIVMAKDDFSTLKGALAQAGLSETLASDGPFTVFAPTNNAFSKLPETELTDLLKPQNKERLTSILTYHVVAGKYAASDVKQAIQDNNGEYQISTMNGGQLTASLEGDKVMITDDNGGKATVEQADVEASNGVVHVINTVLMPEGATGTMEQ